MSGAGLWAGLVLGAYFGIGAATATWAEAPADVLYSSQGDAQAFDAYRKRFSSAEVTRIVERARGETGSTTEALLKLLSRVRSDDQADIDAVIKEMVEVLAEALGLNFAELELLNAGRNLHQIVQYAIIPQITDVVGQPGWRRLPASKAAFHSVGYRDADIAKYVHDNGCEYVFRRDETGWDFVSDGVNTGTFNYMSEEDAVGHLALDILPWVAFGVGAEERRDEGARRDDLLRFDLLLKTAYARARGLIRPAPDVTTVADPSGLTRIQSRPEVASCVGVAGMTAPESVGVDRLPDLARESQPFAGPLSDMAMAESTAVEAIEAPTGKAEAEAVADEWGPGIVGGGDLGYAPCGDRQDIEPCLRELGLSTEATRFAVEVGGEAAGSFFADAFRELGAVDLAEATYVGASSHPVPVLLNGSLGALWIGMSYSPLRLAFMDSASQLLLRRYPQATPRSARILAHRLLADGTQRFVLVEALVDGCMACNGVGTGITFLEVGPATGGRLVRRPVGLVSETAGEGFDGRIREGSTGWEGVPFAIRPLTLQYRLNALGYDAGSMDRVPGPRTQTALRMLQAEHCVVPTGQVDTDTQRVLGAADGFSAPCGASTSVAPTSGPHAAPPGSRWLQTHSRADWSEAVAVARDMQARMPDTRVFRASNGWYAVVARAVAEAEAEQLERIVAAYGLPADAFLVSGDSYVEAVPIATPDRSVASVGSAMQATGTAEPVALRLDDASAVQVAAMLRAAGVSETNTRLANAAAEDELAALITRYRQAAPAVQTPDLPAYASRYDSESGVLSLCVKYELTFSAKSFDGATWGPKPAALSVELPYIRAFGALPQICTLLNMSAVAQQEALHGKGELGRFAVDTGRQVGLVVRADPDMARRILHASEGGMLRAGYTCGMEFGVRQASNAAPSNNSRIGHCKMSAMSLAIVDHAAGTTERIGVRREAGELVANGVFVRETMRDAPVPAGVAGPADRATRSFDTDEIGDAAVRQIVEGFVGGPAEVILGYQNAFPFQSEPSKVLAIAVFGALPQEEVAKVPGTEAGYGSFALKSWSDLNRFYFSDDPAPGLASALLGRIEDLRILSLHELSGSSCEWSVTYRIWLNDLTPFGTALMETSDLDGQTFTACFRATRSGYDLTSLDRAD